jgi:hypothetical protein
MQWRQQLGAAFNHYGSRTHFFDSRSFLVHYFDQDLLSCVHSYTGSFYRWVLRRKLADLLGIDVR